MNFIDTYHRSGLYKVELPHTIGSEASGVVTAVADDVTQHRIGDRIATARANGAYADEATAAANHAVRVPEAINTQTAAALLLQGMTAHYLACDTFPLKHGDAALIHAGAGGVGLLLIQIAKKRGARVITTVGTDEKAKLARDAGADAVCVYTRENFAEAARAFTNGRGVDVAYDAVGKDTFDGTLNSLRPRGMFVSFGNASGAVPPFAPLVLSQKGSLYFTRPTLTHYTLTTGGAGWTCERFIFLGRARRTTGTNRCDVSAFCGRRRASCARRPCDDGQGAVAAVSRGEVGGAFATSLTLHVTTRRRLFSVTRSCLHLLPRLLHSFTVPISPVSSLAWRVRFRARGKHSPRGPASRHGGGGFFPAGRMGARVCDVAAGFNRRCDP